MAQYQPIPSVSWAYLCLDCGCLIGRRATHDRFHDRIDGPHVHYGDIPQTCRDALDEVYKPDGVEAWWNAANRMLAGERPRDLWQTVEGRRRVLAVIEAITVGGVVT